jgi:hypothetical protein
MPTDQKRITSAPVRMTTQRRVQVLRLHCVHCKQDAHTTPPHSRRQLPVHVSLQAMEVDAPLPQLLEARPNKGSRVALYLRPIAPSPSCRQLHMLIGDGVNCKWGGAHVTLCSFAPEHASGEPGPIIVPSHPSSRHQGCLRATELCASSTNHLLRALSVCCNRGKRVCCI